MPKLVGSIKLIVRRNKSTRYPLPVTHYKAKPAFSLIELLIVIAILGILATIVAYVSLQRPKQARDAQRKSDLAQLKRVMEIAKVDCQGKYYPAIGLISIQSLYFLNYYSPGNPPASIAGHLQSIGLTRGILQDPKNETPYFYGSRASNNSGSAVCPDSNGNVTINGSTTFMIRANLEDNKDPDGQKSFNSCTGVPGVPASYPNDGSYYICGD
ncbi:MAG: type II secretion system protein [Candidatus Levybacteria bacterium]|nr:type II secretion system protein [Candidatus Levybacteria bacterium]